MVSEQDMIKEYEDQKREDYEYRADWMCTCGHKGDQHDHDEVGECQSCGCVAFWEGNYDTS